MESMSDSVFDSAQSRQHHGFSRPHQRCAGRLSVCGQRAREAAQVVRHEEHALRRPRRAVVGDAHVVRLRRVGQRALHLRRTHVATARRTRAARAAHRAVNLSACANVHQHQSEIPSQERIRKCMSACTKINEDLKSSR